MYWQTKIVLSSIFLFFIALIFVYLIYFDMNEWERFYNIFSKNPQNELQQNWKNNSKSITWELKKEEEKLFTWEDGLNSWNVELETGDSDKEINDTSKIKDLDDLEKKSWDSENLESDIEKSDFDSGSNSSSDKKGTEENKSKIWNYQKYLLSWMRLYTWNLWILKELDLWNKFILKWKFGSLFAFLERPRFSLEKKVKKLWWNIVEIWTKKNIIKNSLTWDKIVYVNIPEYEGVVNMILVKDDTNWFVQVWEKNYYSFKSYLKDFFR